MDGHGDKNGRVGAVANCSEPDQAGFRQRHNHIPGALMANFVSLVRAVRYVISSETTAIPKELA